MKIASFLSDQEKSGNDFSKSTFFWSKLNHRRAGYYIVGIQDTHWNG